VLLFSLRRCPPMVRLFFSVVGICGGAGPDARLRPLQLGSPFLGSFPLFRVLRSAALTFSFFPGASIILFHPEPLIFPVVAVLIPPPLIRFFLCRSEDSRAATDPSFRGVS